VLDVSSFLADWKGKGLTSEVCFIKNRRYKIRQDVSEQLYIFLYFAFYYFIYILILIILVIVYIN